jgi:hypothetical protein
MTREQILAKALTDAYLCIVECCMIVPPQHIKTLEKALAYRKMLDNAKSVG